MTIAIGAYEAKTRLPELLRAVAGGETFIITHRDRAVAQLVPIDTQALTATDAVTAMQAFVARRKRKFPAAVLDALRREDRR